MKQVLSIILIVVIIGIMGLLCLFSCIASKYADEYWEKIRKELEERNDRGRF